MIPGSFDYHRPTSLREAVALLADLGEEARPLAGGHSLIPMMKLRLASRTISSISPASATSRAFARDGGDIVIGAMTTQHEIVGSDLLAAKLPILRETALLIADPQVRYVGTLGGNVANGDPGNDMPAVMLCLGASYHAGRQSRRAPHSRRASSTRAPISPRSSPASSSPRSAFRCLPRATAPPTRSSSARSATTRPPPPRWF